MAQRKTKAEIEQELEVARHLIKDLEEGHSVNMATVKNLKAELENEKRRSATCGRFQRENVELRDQVASLWRERDTLRAALANLGPVLALLEASDA